MAQLATSTPTTTPTPSQTVGQTATPTSPTATPTASTTTTLPTVPSVATIIPAVGTIHTVGIPGNQGAVLVPGEAVGSAPLKVEVRAVPTPTNVPTNVTVLRALEITFADATTDAAVTELEREVSIEVSYAGLGLTEEQLARLVVYNATRNEYLPTSLDQTRQVAIARTRRFSTFTLALASGPVPRLYLPFAASGESGCCLRDRSNHLSAAAAGLA